MNFYQSVLTSRLLSAEVHGAPRNSPADREFRSAAARAAAPHHARRDFRPGITRRGVALGVPRENGLMSEADEAVLPHDALGIEIENCAIEFRADKMVVLLKDGRSHYTLHTSATTPVY
jgi:hypothetical protein